MKTNEFATAVHEIRILSVVLTKLLRQDIEKHLDACGARLGPVQYTVLRLLAHESQTIAELSRAMMLEAATLVPVIDALERGGWVERGHDPNDRRRTPLTLTPSGEELMRAVIEFSPHSSLVKGLEQMGMPKTRQLLSLLRELTIEMSGDEQVMREIEESVRRHVAGDNSARRTARAKIRKPVIARHAIRTP